MVGHQKVSENIFKRTGRAHLLGEPRLHVEQRHNGGTPVASSLAVLLVQDAANVEPTHHPRGVGQLVVPADDTLRVSCFRGLREETVGSLVTNKQLLSSMFKLGTRRYQRRCRLHSQISKHAKTQASFFFSSSHTHPPFLSCELRV